MQLISYIVSKARNYCILQCNMLLNEKRIFYILELITLLLLLETEPTAGVFFLLIAYIDSYIINSLL